LTQGEEADETREEEISFVDYEISGKVEGSYAEVMDLRELYNQGGRRVVSYLFSLPTPTNVTELDISSSGSHYSYQESQGERSKEEVLDAGNTAYIRYIDSQEAEGLIQGYVGRYSEPALFSFTGNKLLICQFPMDAYAFITVSIRYSFPIKEDGGLKLLEIPLAPSAAFGDSSAGIARKLGGSMMMEINTMRTLEGSYSPSHDITVEKKGLHTTSVSWNGEVNAGEKMVVYFNELKSAFGGGFLNYCIAGKTMFRENEDGYFMFLFNPNTEEFKEQAMPKDIVFIIDTSGSMTGEKIVQARNALKDVLDILSPEDRFTIIRFSNSIGKFNMELVTANPDNVEDGKAWVDGLSANGATDINSALLEGLDILRGFMEPGRPGEVIFLTDGEATAGVTNNENILENVKVLNVGMEIGATMHVFGIGYDVNTFLLDSLSSESAGTTVYIEPEQDIEEVLTPFYKSISSPVLTGISIEMTGIDTISRYPERIPDLYRGGELNIVGAYKLDDQAPLPEKIQVYVNGTTTTGNTSYQFSFGMEEPGKHDFLPRIYATRVVGDILNDIKQHGETDEKIEQVKRYGKRYGIETPYTSLTIHTNSEFDREGFRTLTGEASVQASNLISSYSKTKIASKGLVQNARVIGDRTFINLNGVYIQTDLLPDDQVIELDNGSLEEWINENITIDRFVKFGSTDYFSLASEEKTLDVLALCSELVFTNGEETIGVTRGNLLLYIKNLRTVTWDRSLSISWDTNVPATSVVHYREAGANGNGDWKILRDTGMKRHHNITLTVPYEVYEFSIESMDGDGNTAVKDNNKEYYVSYHFPLAIVAVKTNIGYAAISGEEVIIRWYTNVPADGQLFVRIDGGEWELRDTTSKTQVHEGRFITTRLQRSDQVSVYEFYVTASLDNYHVVEDNDGKYFSFECVAMAQSSPSFDLGYGMMILSILAVVMLSTLFEIAAVKRHGEKVPGDCYENTNGDNGPEGSHIESGKQDRSTSQHRMIGTQENQVNSTFGNRGPDAKED